MANAKDDVRNELRRATVLFGDLSGFTKMSQSMDAEDVTEVVDECTKRLEGAVLRRGGTVIKFIGDEIMAVFGAPQAIEHAPRHAVNAAIDMVEQIARFNGESNIDVKLQLHLGICTGEVLMGLRGGEQNRWYDAMGNTVNLAARLVNDAPKGDIWVSQTTYEETRNDFVYERLPPLELQGFDDPVPAYKVGRLTQHQGQHRQLLLSELVGRDAELARLEEQTARLVAGEGSAVFVVGDAGLGKTRLIKEMLERVPADKVAVVQASALATGENLSFHPFIEVLRRWCGIGDDDERTAVGKLTTALGDLLPGEVDEIFPFLARLLGLPLDEDAAKKVESIDGDALEKRITKSVRDVLSAAAGRAPLFVVLDDLHWADQSSVKLLITLLPLVERLPLLFLLPARPGYTKTSEPVRREARKLGERALEIALEPLDSHETGLLLRNLIRYDDNPATTRNLILPKAQGNPFFIEEVIRVLTDQGAIERLPDGKLRVTDRIGSVVIPGTVQELLMSRVDRLPPGVRQLLEIAAAIGFSFPHPLLAAVMPDPAPLDLALAHLKRAHLLACGDANGEREVHFMHPLAQETVYSSLPKKTRQPLHAQVAAAIEQLYADRLSDFYGMLAYHYGRAENVEKAETYLVKAGDAASRSAASAEALTYFEEALRLHRLKQRDGQDPLVLVRLQKSIGLALLNRGDLPQALDRFDTALSILGDPKPKTKAAATWRFARDFAGILVNVYLHGGTRRGAVTTPRDCEELEIGFHKAKAQSTSSPRGYVASTLRAVRRLGEVDPTAVEQACGMYAASAALFVYGGVSFRLSARILPIAERLVGNLRDQLTYRTMLFLHHYFAGNWEAEREIPVELLDEGQKYGIFWELNTYLGFACERAIQQGRFAAAQQHLVRIQRLVEEYGYDFGRTNLLAMTTFLLMQQGKLTEALAAGERYWACANEEALNVLALATVTKLHCLLGRCSEATEASKRAEDVFQRLGPREVPPYHAGAYLLSRLLNDVREVESAVADGAPPRDLVKAALASERAALAIGRKIARDRPEALRLSGRLAWLLGKSRRAVKQWTFAEREALRLGARPELARLYAEIADRLEAPSAPLRDFAGRDGLKLRAEAAGLLDAMARENEDAATSRAA